MKQAPSCPPKREPHKRTSRMLCVWLPDFSIQRIHCERPDTKPVPIVLYAESGNRANVVAASVAARRSGIRQGTPLAEAQALLDAALFQPHDADADTQALQALAGICYRYSPLVGRELSNGTHCLLLDIAGCSHLHGDESGLALQLVIDLARHGYFAHVAAAGTIGAAWAIARFGHGAGSDRRLRSLPLEALRIPDQLVLRLSEFDLRSIGQLSALPRASLPSRFGPILTERLDQLYGRVEELLVPMPRPEPVAAVWTHEEPVCHRNAIQRVCEELLAEILQKLTSRNEGLLGLKLTLLSDTDEPAVLNIRLARPSDSVAHLLKLLDLKLEHQAVPEWLHTIRLEAAETAILQTRQRNLFSQQESPRDDSHVHRLLERLSTRLGTDVVVRPQLLPEAVPEQAVKYIPHSDAPTAVPGPTRGGGNEPHGRCLHPLAMHRPLVLLAEPSPVHVVTSATDGLPRSFYWNRCHYQAAQCTSLERIATAWWQDAGWIRRDYYQVETLGGARFWLFRDGNNNWFLHGLFE